jgi:superfamily I DNA/RNA helicase
MNKNIKGECVVAGAGCGKTQYLFGVLTPHLQHLLISFSNSSVAVAESRGVTASTLHSLCYQTIKLERELTLASPQSINLAISKVFGIGLKEENEIMEQRERVGLLLNTASFYEDGGIRCMDCEEEEREKVVEFIELLEIGGFATFDMMPYIVIRDNILPALVNINELTQITALAVDEAQDTSPIFLELISRLLPNLPHLKKFYVVGDFRQAIYAVNGSSPTKFWEWLQRNQWLEIKYLDTNYRSHDAIINYCNTIPLPVPKELQGDLKSAKGIGGVVEIVRNTNAWCRMLESVKTTPASYTWLAPTNSQCAQLQRVLLSAGIPTIYSPAQSYIIHLSERSQSGVFWGSIQNLAAAEIIFNNSFVGSVKTVGTWRRLLAQVAFLKHFVQSDGEEFEGDLVKCRLANKMANPFARTKLKKFFGQNKNLSDFMDNSCKYLGLTTDRIQRRWQEKNVDPVKDYYKYLFFWAFGANTNPAKETTDAPHSHRISTIHAFKGMESDVVIVLTPDPNSLSPQFGFGDEQDSLIYYVACSRPRNRLVLLERDVLNSIG